MATYGPMAFSCEKGPVRTTSRHRLTLVTSVTILLGSSCAYGDLLYVGARSNYVTRVDETTGNQLGTFADGFYALYSLTLGPDGNAYVSGITATSQWGVYRFNPITGQPLGTFTQGDLLDDIDFSLDGKFYGVDQWTDELVEYPGSGRGPKRVVLSNVSSSGGITAFHLGTHGDVFAVTGISKIARYDLATGQQIGPKTDLSTLGLPGFGFDQMTFGPDGKLYVAYSYYSRGGPLMKGGVMRFDPLTGSLLDTVISDLDVYGAEAGGSPGIAFGPDGDLYIGSQHAKAVFRYDATTWNQIGQFPLPGFVPSATYFRFLPVPEPALGLLAFLPLLFLGRYRRRSPVVAD
jgi:outer membrane protein assembly factor BamB